MKHDAIYRTASDAAKCGSRSQSLEQCVQSVADWEIDTVTPCSLNEGGSMPGNTP